MIPSNLDEKIEFGIIENDGGVFSNNNDFKVVKTAYANILNLNNSEFIQAYSTKESIIVSFRVIYNRFTKDLPFKTKEYQINWKGNLYDIIAAVPKDRNYVDIKAKVVI